MYLPLAWQIVLKEFKLSLVYPLTSLSLIFLLFIGHFCFNEEVTLNNIIGALIIIMGSFFLSKEKEKNV